MAAANFLLGVTPDQGAKSFSVIARGEDGKPVTQSYSTEVYGALMTGLIAIAPAVGQQVRAQDTTITGVNLLADPSGDYVLQLQIAHGPVLFFHLENETFVRLRQVVAGQ